jgi:Fe-S cluster assembly iron-binding protein IscA
VADTARGGVAQTPAAVGRLKELLQTRPASLGMRVGVAERGCNGLTYTLNFAEKKGPLDAEVHQDGKAHR